MAITTELSDALTPGHTQYCSDGSALLCNVRHVPDVQKSLSSLLLSDWQDNIQDNLPMLPSTGHSLTWRVPDTWAGRISLLLKISLQQNCVLYYTLGTSRERVDVQLWMCHNYDMYTWSALVLSLPADSVAHDDHESSRPSECQNRALYRNNQHQFSRWSCSHSEELILPAVCLCNPSKGTCNFSNET